VTSTIHNETVPLQSAPYTYYQVPDIIRNHISKQSTTKYFNRLF